MNRRILIGGSLLSLFPLALALWIYLDLNSSYFGAGAPEIFVEIPRGAGLTEIADILADAGILRSRIPFLFHVRRTGQTRRLQAGEYRFTEPATPKRVIERLLRGDVYFLLVTVPEGLTGRETVDLIARAGIGSRDEMERALQHTDWIRDLSPTAGSLEGFLFPNTYRFPRKIDSRRVLRTMVEQFRDQFGRLTAETPVPPGLDAAGVVTLASLVEKETGNIEERQLVASVLFNRLRRGIPLACDPTVIYALKLEQKYDGNIRKSDLAMDSPYNTYRHPGLPPGPISNPGSASLRAALSPPKTDYLYFVSRNDGTHEFSKDIRAHQNAVQKYQKQQPAKSSRINPHASRQPPRAPSLPPD